jgi:Rad3-related DNA helicase
MDSRLLKKYYGRQILASLPPAKRGKIKEVRDYLPHEQ